MDIILEPRCPSANPETAFAMLCAELKGMLGPSYKGIMETDARVLRIEWEGKEVFLDIQVRGVPRSLLLEVGVV